MDKIALIIDDSKPNREVLQMMLRTNGITPVTLESPHFLEQTLANQSQIDVVFLDLEFPNYNGLQLVQQLKAHPRLKDAPIIAYTVHTSEVEEARTAGFDGFLGKPLRPHDFADQLRRILNGESVWE